MEICEDEPYILYELPDINSDITQPIQCTQRLKYTCFDVSKNLIVFGATSGGIYVFHRQPISFFNLVPNKEGTITNVRISPNERHICFSTNSGLVFVKECLQQMQTLPQQVSKEHQGKEVTAIVWNDSSQELWIGDSAGNISILHITTFIAKTFNTTTFTLMRLDSRITQMDVNMKMLLVSTMTRTYICDTEREQYRQIGQKMRDGEYGACFTLTSQSSEIAEEKSNEMDNNENHSQVIKEYSSVSVTEKLNGCEDKNHLMIVCSRPGLRLWEAVADGTVVRTYQFKQKLSSQAHIITNEIYESENIDPYEGKDCSEIDVQSINFSQLLPLRKSHIFTYNKNVLFVIDPKSGSLVLWSSFYKDIKTCRAYDSFIYMWMESGNIVVLNFVKVDKFIVTAYLSKKFILCANLCASFDKYLISNVTKLHRLSLLAKFDNVLLEGNYKEEYDRIKHVLEALAKARQINAQKMKSGIFVVKNEFYSRTEVSDEDNDFRNQNNINPDEDGTIFPSFPPEAMQALKGLSTSVSDKLNIGTKLLKQKWDKSLGVEKYETFEKKPIEDVYQDTGETERTISVENCFNEKQNQSSQNEKIVLDSNNGDIVRKLYHLMKNFDLSCMDMLESACEMMCDAVKDIFEFYLLLQKVEIYAERKNDAKLEFASHCRKLFLYYISKSDSVNSLMEIVAHDKDLCKYFSSACMNINIHAGVGDKAVSCECGYPLPNLYSSQTPQFSNVIDLFIELQWNSSQSEHCYDICKRVPYMWRKILYLRRNEDLKNLLILLLQMLDEDLLYTYLPHFTVEVWEKAVQLFAILKGNSCLNCGAKFLKDASESTITWDVIGALMIKSIGGKNAVKILKNYSRYIPASGLSFAFYHSSTLSVLFDKYDCNLRTKLTDTVYEAYKYPGSLEEIINLLGPCLKSGTIQNTSLPFSIASKSKHWGLNTTVEAPEDALGLTWFSDSTTRYIESLDVRELTQERCLLLLDGICPNKVCLHCSLPLNSPVLLRDGGLLVFVCGHTFHSPCLKHLKIRLCPMCEC